MMGLETVVFLVGLTVFVLVFIAGMLTLMRIEREGD